METILEDKRTIVGLAEGQWFARVGDDDITKIVAYAETGQRAYVPWFAIFKGDVLTHRIDAAGLLISYET